MVSSWGSTETAPLVTSVHFDMERAGVIGLPVPGVELKMVPNGGKMELRVRGPNVTPGYFKRPDLTREAFDADGYYCIGDAGRFANRCSGASIDSTPHREDSICSRQGCTSAACAYEQSRPALR